MRTLFLDLETSPITAYVWGLWDQNVGLSQIIDTSKTLCWSAKWLGENEVHYGGINKQSHRSMVRDIYDLVDAADVVCHYNGNKFDIPVLNKEFVLQGFSQPSPYKNLDLLRVVKSKFRFPSNKLDFVAEQLGLGNKQPTNFNLWVDCMNGDKEAWKTMEEYNKHDVVLLERLYGKLFHWIKHPINHSVFGVNSAVCPNCGSSSFVKRGYAVTTTCRYQRFKCQDCKHWFRDTINVGPKAGNKFTGVS